MEFPNHPHYTSYVLVTSVLFTESPYKLPGCFSISKLVTLTITISGQEKDMQALHEQLLPRPLKRKQKCPLLPIFFWEKWGVNKLGLSENWEKSSMWKWCHVLVGIEYRFRINTNFTGQLLLRQFFVIYVYPPKKCFANGHVVVVLGNHFL